MAEGTVCKPSLQAAQGPQEHQGPKSTRKMQPLAHPLSRLHTFLPGLDRMIIKSSVAPYGDRASARGTYTGAGGTGRDSARRDRAWSLAGPIQRAASIWTSAQLPEKRGVESIQFHPGLGVEALVGKVFQKIGSVLQTPSLAWERFSPRKSPKPLCNPSLAWEIHTHPPTILVSRATHDVSQRSVSQSASAAGLLLRLSSHYPQHPTPRLS